MRFMKNFILLTLTVEKQCKNFNKLSPTHPYTTTDKLLIAKQNHKRESCHFIIIRKQFG